MKQLSFAFLLFALASQINAQSVDELILNKRFDQALTKISSQIQERPSGELYFKQALIYEAQFKLTDAVKSLEQALLYEPENSIYLAELGDNYTALGNVWQAIPVYQQAVEIKPEENSFKGKLGKAYLNVDDFGKAYDVFDAIYRGDSLNVMYNKQFAFAAFKTGKSDQSIRLYEKVVADNPGDFGSHLNLMAVYKKKKIVDKFQQTSERALTIFPDNGTILLREGDGLFEMGRYEKAVIPYEQLLAKKDSSPDVMKNYGISLYMSDQEEKAKEILEICFYKAPNDPFVNYYLGLCYKYEKDFARSAEFFVSAIACAQPPYESEMYHTLGQVYGLMREFEKSINALKKSFECNPENFEVLFEIATTYEEFDFNKTLALNYYSEYLKTGGLKAKNVKYAQNRMQRLKEELFIGEN